MQKYVCRARSCKKAKNLTFWYILSQLGSPLNPGLVFEQIVALARWASMMGGSALVAHRRLIAVHEQHRKKKFEWLLKKRITKHQIARWKDVHAVHRYRWVVSRRHMAPPSHRRFEVSNMGGIIGSRQSVREKPRNAVVPGVNYANDITHSIWRTMWLTD